MRHLFPIGLQGQERSEWQELNLRPAVLETAVLPTALHPDVLMLPAGFEPAKTRISV